MEPTSNPSEPSAVSPPPPPPQAVTNAADSDPKLWSPIPTPKPRPSVTAPALAIVSVLAAVAWALAAWSSYDQKHKADELIADAIDVSAVQIQQLNGQVTAHALVAMVMAMALTIPLVIVAVHGVTRSH